jgi:hypothetical protein
MRHGERDTRRHCWGRFRAEMSVRDCSRALTESPVAIGLRRFAPVSVTKRSRANLRPDPARECPGTVMKCAEC